MLNRISKTILILTICLGISVPTNAAVSVSDGSAFVTKAEFAADLNNLSNRMAQLENSLDAKIDSLVSSYLTRNGIWNGAVQYNKDYTKIVNYGMFTNDQWLNFFRGYGNAFDSGWKLVGDGSGLTKTGLVMLKVANFGTVAAVGDEWWITVGNPSDYGGYQIGAVGVECLIATGASATNNSVVSRIDLYKRDSGPYSNIYIGFKPYEFTNVVSFMVNKGEYVYGRVKTYGGIRSKITTDSGAGGLSPTGREKYGVQIGELTIY